MGLAKVVHKTFGTYLGGVKLKKLVTISLKWYLQKFISTSSGTGT
jgi:hypothetical protein